MKNNKNKTSVVSSNTIFSSDSKLSLKNLPKTNTSKRSINNSSTQDMLKISELDASETVPGSNNKKTFLKKGSAKSSRSYRKSVDKLAKLTSPEIHHAYDEAEAIATGSASKMNKTQSMSRSAANMSSLRKSMSKTGVSNNSTSSWMPSKNGSMSKESVASVSSA